VFASQPDVAQAEAAVVRAVVPRVAPMLIFGVLVALIPLVIGGFAVFGVVKSLGSLIGRPGGSTFGTLSTLVTAPGKLGGNMLRREAYYPTVVEDIKNDKNFRAALGSPIAIDEDGISCRTIKNGYTSNTANCTLPVRGPRASGDVTVVVVDQPGSFGVAGKLTTAGRTIEMGQP
jgi:hypothetical protein